MKNARQRKILEIIEKYEIGTQEELIEKLLLHGFNSTQTTVSRDLRDLRIIKGPTGLGTYKYVAPGEGKQPATPAHNSAFTDAVTKIDSAMNIVVLKTHPGMANAIAVCIENLGIRDVVGSVAGDDTLLMIMRSVEDADRVVAHLKEVFRR
jgi:transcriptional regulator of arginine metabolism